MQPKHVENYIKLTKVIVTGCILTAALVLILQRLVVENAGSEGTLSITPYIVLMCGTIASHILAEKRFPVNNPMSDYFEIIIPTVLTLLPIMVIIAVITDIKPRIEKHNEARERSKTRAANKGKTLKSIHNLNLAVFALISIQQFIIVLFFSNEGRGLKWLSVFPLMFLPFVIWLSFRINILGEVGFADG